MCIDVHTYTQADTAKRQNRITFLIIYSKDGFGKSSKSEHRLDFSTFR